MSEGAVWLHRKLLDSDIWTASDQTLRLMITCLLMANWEDQQWYNRSLHKTQLIPRGDFVSTFKSLAIYSRLSTQGLRSALMNLENMQFLTRKVTGRVTQITILKYNEYQKLVTRRVTDKVTTRQQLSNNSSTQLEEVKEVKELKEERGNPSFASLQEYVNTWKQEPEWMRKDNAAAIAEGLKKYKLGYRVEEDLYQQIMGEQNGTIRSKSIFEQAAERHGKKGLTKAGGDNAQWEVLARLRDLPKVSPKTGLIDGGRGQLDDKSV